MKGRDCLDAADPECQCAGAGAAVAGVRLWGHPSSGCGASRLQLTAAHAGVSGGGRGGGGAAFAPHVLGASIMLFCMVAQAPSCKACSMCNVQPECMMSPHMHRRTDPFPRGLLHAIPFDLSELPLPLSPSPCLPPSFRPRLSASTRPKSVRWSSPSYGPAGRPRVWRFSTASHQ